LATFCSPPVLELSVAVAKVSQNVPCLLFVLFQSVLYLFTAPALVLLTVLLHDSFLLTEQSRVVCSALFALPTLRLFLFTPSPLLLPALQFQL
jgi:hypothetical protein